MISLRFNNGWKSGEFNLILIDVSNDGRNYVAALAFLGFGIALVYEPMEDY